MVLYSNIAGLAAGAEEAIGTGTRTALWKALQTRQELVGHQIERQSLLQLWIILN